MTTSTKDFWRSAAIEPKRGYRWYITFEALGTVTDPNGEGSTFGNGALQYACKRVDKPGISISETEHTYLNHKFYYPGRVDWSEVSVSFVDVVGSNGAADIMLSLINNAGYTVPTAANDTNSNLHTLGKYSLNAQIGDVTITQVNAAGEDIETWTLKNGFIKSVRMSGLDYGSEEMATVDISIRYDWASYARPTTASPAGDSSDASALAGQTLWGKSSDVGPES